MLIVDKITVSYGSKTVLNEISFTTKKSEIVGILGKNGAGKTTLFNTIAGYTNFSGNIFLNDEKIMAKKVSYLDTENYFYPYMKGNEFLDFFIGTQKEKALYLAETFDLPLDEYIHNYSTGMKKKIALIGSFLLEKPLLILDEPFNGLDFESVENLYSFIKQTAFSETSVLISSHILETLLNCCDKIILLEKTRVKKEYLRENFDVIRKDIETTYPIP